MRNQIFTRTTAAVIAIAMLMMLVLLTTPGNNAQGQSLPSVSGSRTSTYRSTSPTRARTG